MKQLTTVILILVSSFLFAQDESLKEARKLIENKKYESAFKVLRDADPDNNNPDIVIEKSMLLMDYFVMSIMHKTFSLKDLEPEEDIMDYRGQEGVSEMYDYNPEVALKIAIEKYPDNYELRKTLGYYYHEIFFKYGGRWLEPDSVVVKSFFENYKIAFDNGIFDDRSLYGIGYGLITSQKYRECIPYFEKSIELNPDYPTSHYNLAYAYLYIDDRENAIKYAKNALELYDYPPSKADAARIVAVCYSELEQYESSMEYYRKSNEIDPNNYYTLKPLLSVEIYLNKDNYKERTKEFFLLAPENPTIYQDLMQLYWKYEKQDELIGFLDSLKPEFEQESKVYANLYFFIAIIQYDSEDFENAKSNFEKSKEIFSDVFEPGHRVFEAIDSYLKEI